MKREYGFLLLVLIISTLLLMGCGVKEYKTTEVTATVIEKEYDAPEKKKYKDSNGKTKTKTKPAEWEVTIQYQDIVKEFEHNNKQFYNQVEEGQQIQVMLIEGFDENGKRITQDIELVED